MALLALLDQSTPCPAARIPHRNAFEKIGYHFKRGQLTHALMDFFVYRRYRWIKRRIIPQDHRIKCVMDAHQAAVMNYIPQVYPGKITLFRSSEFNRMEKENFWARRWSEFATGGFDCHVIEGNHLEIFREPRIQELAKQLKLCLDEAQQTTQS
ncbi:Dimodular non-ribosomal peptide synthetase, thioesterase domain protein [Candidatus Thiomargarita nelsonii]|uniref:Dimodular non-ribosomal peptide synthetase, thioesterase domain protein n=1 Tax=Candidatus Thiomargarita nelsonii TaxID=1003181 RepID=A0A176RTJ8_9GAMM|nr:Dimodular non-ribosomal peptide synthetase, thioesterase domain protein [Candidatus Thiomargarita nelsonii]